MTKLTLPALLALAITAPAYASADLCLDCHEPAEDWEGMSAAEILEVAQDPEVEDHEDNRELSTDELKAIIAELAPDA